MQKWATGFLTPPFAAAFLFCACFSSCAIQPTALSTLTVPGKTGTICDKERPGHSLPQGNDDDGLTRAQRTALLRPLYPSTVEVWQHTFDKKGKSYIFSGSGAIIDDRGSVFTNHHVVEKTGEIYVAPRYLAWNGKVYTAFRKRVRMRIVAVSRTYDIAWLMPAETKSLPRPLSQARIRPFLYGERLWHLGKTSQWSFGRLSSFNPIRRRARDIPDAIEMGAFGQRGDSGAPVVDASGMMAGVFFQTCYGLKEAYFIPLGLAKRAVGYVR